MTWKRLISLLILLSLHAAVLAQAPTISNLTATPTAREQAQAEHPSLPERITEKLSHSLTNIRMNPVYVRRQRKLEQFLRELPYVGTQAEKGVEGMIVTRTHETDPTYPLKTWDIITRIGGTLETLLWRAAALFLLVGILYERTHTRQLDEHGGVAGIITVKDLISQLKAMVWNDDRDSLLSFIIALVGWFIALGGVWALFWGTFAGAVGWEWWSSTLLQGALRIITGIAIVRIGRWFAGGES